AIRVLQDQPTEQFIGPIVSPDITQQLRPRKHAGRVIRLGQMVIHQRHGLFNAPVLHEAHGAKANDLQVFGAVLQKRGPLLGQPLVYASRLLQSEKQKPDLEILQVVIGQRLRAAQVFLRDLDAARRGNDFFQLRLNLFKIRRDLRSEEHTSELQSRENLV